MPLTGAHVTRRTEDARQALGLIPEQLFAVCPPPAGAIAVRTAGPKGRHAARQRSMNDEVHMSQDTPSSTATVRSDSGRQGHQGDAFENLLNETRAFPPTPD